MAMTSNPTQRQPLLAFSVATWRLAVPLADVRRVVPMPILQPSPGAPRFVEGFFDYAGEPLAAVRLDRLFKLDEEPLGIYAPLVVLRVEGPGIALHVRGIDGILDAPDIQPIGRGETFNACVVGRVSDAGDTVYVLSKDELLLAEERAKIAAYGTMKQERLDNIRPQLAHAS